MNRETTKGISLRPCPGRHPAVLFLTSPRSLFSREREIASPEVRQGNKEKQKKLSQNSYERFCES